MGVIKMQKLINAVRIFLSFAILLGLVYPLLILVLGQIFFPYQAGGSLIAIEGRSVGSSLIAQEFTSHRYFQSRFSAINYNATDSGGSNLAMSNAKLYQKVEKYIKHVRLENELAENVKLPADMVLCSGSGLDPHISLANAMLQLPRVAKHRGLSKEIIKKLINDSMDHDFIGIWGQKGVNVLRLNLALDKFGH